MQTTDIAPPVARQAITFAVVREKFEIAETEFDRLWQLHLDAEEQLPERVDYFFDDYGLLMGMTREQAVAQATTERAIKGDYRFEGRDGLIVAPKDKAEACRAHHAAVNAKIEHVADDFMAYQEKHRREAERHCVRELNDAAREYGEKVYFPARERLMHTPATDLEGLVLKMRIAATWVDEPFVDAVFDDAKRLLSSEA